MSDALVGPGHNRPPSPIEQITIDLSANHAGVMLRKVQLLTSVDEFLAKYPAIETQQVAEAAAENLDMLTKLIKRLNALRVVDKEPFLEGGRAVDGWFKVSTDSLQTAWNKLNKPNAAYLSAVEKRNREAAAAEAKRLSDLAEKAVEDARAGTVSYDNAIELAENAVEAARHAGSSVINHSRMTGSYGTSVSLARSYDFEITDPEAVPRHLCSPDPKLIRAAIKTAGLVSGNGLRIFPVDKTRTR